MKRLLSLSLIAVATLTASAQPAWKTLQRRPMIPEYGNVGVSKLAASSSGVLLAYGAGGTSMVLRSRDHGETWELAKWIGIQEPTLIAHADTFYVWHAPNQHTQSGLWKVTNSGRQWTRVFTGYNILYQVIPSTRGRLFVSEQDYNVRLGGPRGDMIWCHYTDTAGGSCIQRGGRFSPLLTPNPQWLVVRDSSVLAQVSTTVWKRSDDGGLTWREVGHSPVLQALQSERRLAFSLTASGGIRIVTPSKVIFSPDGQSFATSLDASADPIRTTTTAAGRTWLMRESGQIQYTLDEGQTWQTSPLSVPESLLKNFQQLLYSPDGFLYVVSWDGFLRSDAPVAVAAELPSTPVQEVRMYPQPARRTVTLEIKSTLSEDGTLEILDLLGRQVLREPWTQLQSTTTRSVDIGTLPSGVYVYRVTLGSHVATGRLVVAR